MCEKNVNLFQKVRNSKRENSRRKVALRYKKKKRKNMTDKRENMRKKKADIIEKNA